MVGIRNSIENGGLHVSLPGTNIFLPLNVLLIVALVSTENYQAAYNIPRVDYRVLII